MNITTQNSAFTVDASNLNQWTRHLLDDPACIGVKVQNQDNGGTGCKFWVAASPQPILEMAFRIDPGTGIIEDFLPDTGEVWVYGNTLGSILTVMRKHQA